MKVLQQSLGENPEQGSQDTSPGHLMHFPMESRAKVEQGSGKHGVYMHYPKDSNCVVGLKTKITRSSCRRRAGTVVPREESFGLDSCVSQNSQWRKCIAEQSSTWRGGARFGNPVATILPMQDTNFPGDPEEPNEFPGASKETKSH